jgi:hypothetical protein
MTKKGKGWIRVGQFATKELAEQRKLKVPAKGLDFKIERGTKGAAWGTAHVTYRLWAREQRKRS